MRITPLISSLLLCAGILTGATTATAAQNFRELDRPLPMPAFQLPGLDGRGGSDADLRNKVTIIRFWASWWSTCVADMPSVQKAHDELKKEGIQVITVSIDGTGEAAVRPLFKKGGYTLPALIDSDMNAARGFGVRSVPYTVIVDTRGRITARGYGHVDFGGRILRDYVRGLAARK